MNDYLVPIIVVSGFIVSAIVDNVRIDNLKEDLKQEIYKSATHKAQSVKNDKFNESINSIDKEYSNDVKDLNSTPIGGTIRF